LITGDEEGVAVNGTVKLLEWLKERGEKIDHCVVGEPTSVGQAGDTLKIGGAARSISSCSGQGCAGPCRLSAKGQEPHSRLGRTDYPIGDPQAGQGQPSISILPPWPFTSVDVGNDATNVIPARREPAFNIRFNDKHTPDSLTNWVKDRAQMIAGESGCEITVTSQTSGVSFLTAPGKFTQLISDTIAGITGQAPFFSTSGGTSDARFIKDVCPVVELGWRAPPCTRPMNACRWRRSRPDRHLLPRCWRPISRNRRFEADRHFRFRHGRLDGDARLESAAAQESFVYLGDTARLPYGTKSADTVTRYAVQASATLMKHDIKLLVVACNTASAAALPTLTETLAPLPVVGVIEPGAQAAVAAAPDGPIAVIATEGTVKGGAYVRAIQARSPQDAGGATGLPLVRGTGGRRPAQRSYP
jgi:hypothetical protein